MTEIICSGFGGQGVLVAGMILADAGMEDGKNVTWYPSYGSEMRGGTANCNIKISDEEIPSPYCHELDILYTLNDAAIDKFESQIRKGGIEMLAARGQMLLAARAAGVQCFDTMFPNIDDMEGYKAEVIQNHEMGFDGKSIVNPRQIELVHEIFAPTPKEIAYAEKLVRGCQAQADAGVGVYTVDGKMVDIPFFEDAKRIIALAKACGVYHGDL